MPMHNRQLVGTRPSVTDYLARVPSLRRSFLMAIDKPLVSETSYSGNQLKLRFWGATDDASASDLKSVSGSGLV